MTPSFPEEEEISVLKDGQRIGPYDVDEILDLIEAGDLSYDDVCLREGSLETERLRDVLDWDDSADEEEPLGEEEKITAPEAEPLPSTILFRGHPSIFMSPGAILTIVLGIGLGLYLYGTDFRYTVAGLAIAILGITKLSYVRFTCDYLITRKRIEVIKGLIARSSAEVRIDDVRSINVTCQGLSGIFGIGTVDFFTSGDKPEISFTHVWNAKKVKAFVRKLQDRKES